MPGSQASPARQHSSRQDRSRSSTTSSSHETRRRGDSQSYGSSTVTKKVDRSSSSASAAAAVSATATTRPRMNSRSHTAPLVPKSPRSPTVTTSKRTKSSASASQITSELSEDEGIATDPFFQRYQVGKAEPSRLRTGYGSDGGDSSSETEGAMSPVTIKTPQFPPAMGRSPHSPAYASHEHSGVIQEINIGVLGGAHVGKTHLIHKALDLRHAPTTRTSSRKMSIHDMVHVVRLLEIPFDELFIEQDDSIRWPDTIDDTSVPHIDGVLVLYDVMREASLDRIPEFLNALHKEAIPYFLVGCKCDHHPATRAVDPGQVEQKVRAFLGDINALQTSGNAPETQQRCLSVTLRAIVKTRQEQLKFAAARRRANSSAARHMSRPLSGQHARASSEFSGARFRSPNPNTFDDDGTSKPSVRNSVRSARSKTTSSTTQTFLDLEASSGYDTAESDRPSSSDAHDVSGLDERGASFDYLVEKLLAQPLSKQDTKFIDIFLALYRKFAAPSQLLEAIIKRFNSADRAKNSPMSKTVIQLRQIAILDQWVCIYPGDFAYMTTFKMMRDFASKISSERIFAVGASEILKHLEGVFEDDDTDWACSDKTREGYPATGTKPLLEKNDSAKNLLSHTALLDDNSDDEFVRDVNKLSMSSDASMQLSLTSESTTPLSPQTTRTSISSRSQKTVLLTFEGAQQQAKQLLPTAKTPLGKVQWHLLMGEPDESIAREMTRIDWIMFSSIRPRDLVRHVTLAKDQKQKCKSLENVTRIIDHFNHVAYWVANFVLLRDKPKHRAMMLEKFMRIARKLRELNNYNALGAVLAGLNGSAVHRLIATRDCISPAAARDFMRLEILMGTQRSHFAYRMAWENSSSERIPYLPLHLRDLISATEGNRTFVEDPIASPNPNAPNQSSILNPRSSGGSTTLLGPSTPSATITPHSPLPQLNQGPAAGKRINWRKFEIMGEVIVGVQRAQQAPYHLPPSRNEEFKSWLLDTKIVKDDEEIYERSIALEPSPAGSGGKGRFAWFKGGLSGSNNLGGGRGAGSAGSLSLFDSVLPANFM